MKTVFTIIVTLSLMLGLHAQAQDKVEDLKEGVNYKFTQGGAVLYVKLDQLKDGIAYIETERGKWLYARGTEEGDVIEGNGSKDQATRWVITKGSKGWSFTHAAKPANALCREGVGPKGDGKSTGVLKLRRHNAGGNGMEDQLWQLQGVAN